MFFTGFAMIGFNIPVSVLIQTKVNPKMLGKTSSVMASLSQALIPIATILAGFIISNLSVQFFFAFTIIGTVLIAIWFNLNKDLDSVS
jgi:predicted MFS family arabinose efflux permease